MASKTPTLLAMRAKLYSTWSLAALEELYDHLELIIRDRVENPRPAFHRTNEKWRHSVTGGPR